MARLSPEARALLYLRYAQDITPAEIARILAMRPGTVKSQLHRTLHSVLLAVALFALLAGASTVPVAAGSSVVAPVPRAVLGLAGLAPVTELPTT